MSATKHSAEVFLVVDPPQDYEESLVVWGVYGSITAAKHATHRLRRKNLRDTWAQQRYTEVQHWRGDELIETWTYHGHPDSAQCATWTYQEAP